MLKIGEFSRIAQVSSKTLRLYDERNLLKPAWIDRFTGYRYYRVDQLAQLNHILVLKDLGFSLEQIRQLLAQDLPPAELRGMLRLKRAELQEQIESEQARLVQIEARLRQVEQEGLNQAREIRVKPVPPLWVAGLRGQIPDYSQIDRLIEDLERRLQQAGLVQSAADPWIGVYYDAEYQEQGIDVEIAAPLPGAQVSSTKLRLHELPAVEAMACALHHGAYDQLPQTFNALLAWIEDSGYQMTGPVRNVYLKRPSTDGSEDLLTEVQFAVQAKPTLSVLFKNKEQIAMEPKIVNKPAFKVVGLTYHGKNEQNEIAQVWDRLNQRFVEIEQASDPPLAYGLCCPTEADGRFAYMAGFAVQNGGGIPLGMEVWEVPAQMYAVFPCTLKTIHEAYQYAYQTWLPQSAFNKVDGIDFEFYDSDFDIEKEQLLTIYIPVSPK